MRIGKIFTVSILITASFLALFPFYFMFVSGTNTNTDILTVPPRLLPGMELVRNFQILNGRIGLLRSIWNTLFVSVMYTIISTVLFSAAGYALALFVFKGRRFIFGFILASMMIPSLVMYVPLFEMMITMHLTDTYAGVIFPLLANAFGIFLMRQNMLRFPAVLLEAARIDGVGELGIFIRIVLPNVKPALGALIIYMFTGMWNNFMWPLIILGSKRLYTLPVSLAMLDGNPTNKNYAVILLAASIATLPVLVTFFIFQKQFIAGVMGGAVKE